jgi:cell division protein FtsB
MAEPKVLAVLRGRRVGRRLIAVAVILGIAWFAVQGGEYGTFDLLSQRRGRAALQHDIDTLQKAVDSLGAFRTAIARDPAVQERIAREEFGMVRGEKELLYRYLDRPDSAR